MISLYQNESIQQLGIYQLKQAENASLHIDTKMAGVGGTTITAREPYRTYPPELADADYTIISLH